MTGTGGSKPIRLPDKAGFASLSMMVWRHGPVTAEALVNRFSDKLGSPVVTRTFDRDEIGYQWRTQHGTTVDLLEGLTGDGQPPHWSVLLPESLVQKATGERAMDETPLGMVGFPALRSLYLAAVGKAAKAISPNCMEAPRQMAGPFMLWPDAKQGGLTVQPSRLPHVSAACGVPALIGSDMLRRQGKQSALLDAIATEYRAAINQVPVR